MCADDVGRRVGGGDCPENGLVAVNPLAAIIKAHIAAHGPIDMATYMSMCLTHPDHGYYTARAEVLGTRGDFTTAPEISQLFGEMIGFWVADLWAQMGKPAFYLIELGPGRGTLMADALRILSRVPGIMNAVQVHLVEISDPLIAHQAASLQGHDVTWHDSIDDLPTDRPLMVVNNEFFDALPVRQYRGNAAGLSAEVVVGVQQGELCLGLVPIAGARGADDQDLVIELSPVREATARILHARLAIQGGAMLTIDYGYAEPPGVSTLQAVRAHQKVNVLEGPGTADLTALVDFGQLAAWARADGLNVVGPIPQGVFLKTLGVDERLRHILRTVEEAPREALYAGLHRLTADDQMGTLFKVICVYKGALSPAGFGS